MGGKTIWVVQDALSNYMTNNTGLKLAEMNSGIPNQVNIIASSGDATDVPVLYSGPILSTDSEEPSFSDILKAPFLPEKAAFLKKVSVPPIGSFIVPDL